MAKASPSGGKPHECGLFCP